MRRLTSTAVIVAAVATLLGTSPVPAAPRASVTYRGTGQDMFNNAPSWVKAPGKGKSISFKVSKDGTRVLNFRGRYAYYCGAGASTITAGVRCPDRAGPPSTNPRRYSLRPVMSNAPCSMPTFM